LSPLRKMIIVSVVLLVLSLLLIPISYTPARVSRDIDMTLGIGSGLSGHLERILGLEEGVKYVESLDLYGNLSCYRAASMKIYYSNASETIDLEPGIPVKIPANDTNVYIYIGGIPGCEVRFWGNITYNIYKYVWVSAISFVLGLAGGIVLLRVLAADLSRRIP